MNSHGSVAKKVRLHKEEHPERYCPNSKCLWRLSSGNCPKHMRLTEAELEGYRLVKAHAEVAKSH